MTGRVLVVIPALNEAAHIGPVIDGLLPFAARSGTRIVVADGGSGDGTQAIVATRMAAGEPVTLLHNPARLQAAAVNLAVQMFGEDAEWLIRVDAHAAYPADFCDVLLAEAAQNGADSVVVGMNAVGQGLWQAAIAAAQNSRFGNGGAGHRIAPVGRFVDHGHHALMNIAMFRSVGGYDPDFSHNEDVELDLRLRTAGARIWLTAATQVTYFPRRSLRELLQQYFRFGRGRAQNILKHGSRPGLRQIVVIALAPALALALLAPLHWVFALPLIVWAMACAVAGVIIAQAAGDLRGLLAGVAAGAMHAAWSAGFWSRLARGPATSEMGQVRA
jgi:succinoglycan biosynthesis protein ExoA